MMEERVRLKVYGRPNFTMNLLVKHSIVGYRSKFKEDVLIFSVSIKDYEKIKIIFRDYGRKYEVISQYGGLINFKKVSQKYLYFAGLIVGVILIYFYSILLRDIAVYGAKNVSQDLVKSVVGECVALPSLNLNLDLDKVENRLVELDGIAYAKVYKQGSTICVEIVEELPKVDIIDTQNPKPLVANEDGVITKILVYGGSTTYQVGMEVKKGDELILPYIISQEGETKSTQALGKVMAKVERVEELSYSSQDEFNERSARDIEERIAAFKASLSQEEQFLGSRISVKNVDKSIVCSIYYELITRIA
ncbi:MAG: sporulation protein YqfD [Clostridia bacterium]|nr:sporulation protein YqfD [Clostridia bacterium]